MDKQEFLTDSLDLVNTLLKDFLKEYIQSSEYTITISSPKLLTNNCKLIKQGQENWCDKKTDELKVVDNKSKLLYSLFSNSTQTKTAHTNSLPFSSTPIDPEATILTGNYHQSTEALSKPETDLLKSISKLEEGSKAGILVHSLQDDLSSLYQEDFYLYVVKNKLLNSVIKLPSYSVEVDYKGSIYLFLFENADLQKQKQIAHSSRVLYIDLQQFYNQFSQPVFCSEEFITNSLKLFKYKVSVENICGFLTFESLLGIKENGNWPLASIKIGQGLTFEQFKDLRLIGSFTKGAPFLSYPPMQGRVMNTSYLKKDFIDYEVNVMDLPIESVSVARGYRKITAPVVIVSLVGGNLRPTFCQASLKTPVFLHSTLRALVVDTSIVEVKYLILQMYQEYFLSSLEFKSKGIALKHYALKDILTSVLLLPKGIIGSSMQEQNSVYEHKYRQNQEELIKNHQIKQTIDAFLKEQLNEKQWQLHDLRNKQLSVLKMQLMMLDKVANKQEERFKEFTLFGNNGNLYDYVQQLNSSMNALTNRIDEIWKSTNSQSQKNIISILDFLQQYLLNQRVLPSEIFVYDNLEFDRFLLEVERDLGDHKALKVYFDISNLEQILENIFSNIAKHANFNPMLKNENKIKISLDIQGEYLKLVFYNSGEIPNISESSYYSDGGKAGRFAGTGTGGYIIKRLLEQNNSKPLLFLKKDQLPNEYVFGIGFYVKCFINK